MAKKKRLVLSLVLVVVALMSVFVPAVNAVSQDWYLCPVDTRLNKTSPADDTHSFTGWSEWEAGPAQSNLTIGAGEWTLHIKYETPPQMTGRLYVEVWNGSMRVADTSKYISSSGTLDLDMDGISADFKKGEYLILKMNWTSYYELMEIPLEVLCGNGRSLLKSPSTDPGYPIPELNTFVLSSVGLIALACYMMYRKKRI